MINKEERFSYLNLAIRRIVNLVYVNKCKICGQPRQNISEVVCRQCWQHIDLIKAPYCERCCFPFEFNDYDEDKQIYICGECRRHRRYFNKARAICRYSGNLREIIHYYKYNGYTSLEKKIIKLMCNNSSTKLNMADYHVLIPVPLSKKRLYYRGFNQASRIAKGLGNYFHIPIYRQGLYRILDTHPQSSLSKDKRFKNIKGSFSSNNDNYLSGKNVLLIDDIYTTGATVNECARVLKKASVKRVDVLTLARA